MPLRSPRNAASRFARAALAVSLLVAPRAAWGESQSAAGPAGPGGAGAVHEGVTITPAPAPPGATAASAPEAHEGVTVSPLPPSSPSVSPPPPPPPPQAASGPLAPGTAAARHPASPVASARSPGIASAFGDPGTLVVVGGASFGLGVSPEHRSTIAHAIDLGAAFEVFPFTRVSLGTVLSVAYAHYLDGERTVGFGVTERVGYVVRLGRGATLWPRLGVTGSREVREGGQDPGHATAIDLTAYVPFQIEPFPHLLVGLGPEARFDLRQRLDGAGRPSGGRLGLSTEIIAWF